MRWIMRISIRFAEAVRYGHEIGLKFTPGSRSTKTITAGACRANSPKQHPQFRWVNRDGTCLSLATELRISRSPRYKLAIIQGTAPVITISMACFLDWIRTGDVRDNPQTDYDGVAN